MERRSSQLQFIQRLSPQLVINAPCVAAFYSLSTQLVIVGTNLKTLIFNTSALLAVYPVITLLKLP